MSEKQETVVEGEKVEKAPEQSAETQKDDKPIMVPKTRMDEIIAQRDEARAKVSAVEKSQKDAQAAALAEQGKYKELYEKQVTEAEKAQANLAQIKQESLQKEIAQTAGYPLMWDRISGDTQEALEADMAKLVEAFPQLAAPNINGGTSSGQRATAGGKGVERSDAERKRIAGMFNVPWEDVPKLEVV
ncbi:MAG: hypothetical protein DRQ45_01875 [Gammaproteobacteria bacterium]|nr:MAG: hypothetical protein DRQ45_01875 [Gammaproteobacteria bacterium]